MLPGAFDRGRIIWRAVRPCSASRTWAIRTPCLPVLPRDAVERQSSAALTAANVSDPQSRDPFGCMHLTPDKLQNSQVSANACRAR